MFKVKARTVTKRERKERIYKVLKTHPEGLTMKQVSNISGFEYRLTGRVLWALEGQCKAHHRKIGGNNQGLWYSWGNSRRIRNG